MVRPVEVSHLGQGIALATDRHMDTEAGTQTMKEEEKRRGDIEYATTAVVNNKRKDRRRRSPVWVESLLKQGTSLMHARTHARTKLHPSQL